MEQKDSLHLKIADSLTAVLLMLMAEKIKYEDRCYRPITKEKTLNRDYFESLHNLYSNK